MLVTFKNQINIFYVIRFLKKTYFGVSFYNIEGVTFAGVDLRIVEFSNTVDMSHLPVISMKTSIAV